MVTVDLVLPALNEAEALSALLERLPAGYQAIVVDNGSTDGTAAVAARLGAHVILEPKRGFGAAVNAGVTAATAEYVAIMDADGSFDPQELVELVALVADGQADLVLGRRMPTSRNAWPVHARFANRMLARSIRRLTGLPLHDLGPMRVMRREALVALQLQDRRSGYPLEMLLRAHRARWRVAEVPVSYSPRVGRSKVTGTLKGTLSAITDMRRLLRGYGAA